MVDIFIRSYYKDFQWLEYCLKSIDNFCSGYRKVIVVIPQHSIPYLKKYSITDCEIMICENFKDDYMGQQITKLYADSYSDADFICHLDSDTIFIKKINFYEYLSINQVVLDFAPYLKLNRPENYHWKICTDAFLGFNTDNEFMFQDPYIYPKWVYKEFRKYCNNKYKMDLKDFILNCNVGAFSEYNTVGAFLYHYFRDEFKWNDLTLDNKKPLCKKYWSYGGITPAIKSEILRYFKTFPK